MDVSNIFPATVVTAIVLFVVRECLESGRRRATERRRLHAMKRILARECERSSFPLAAAREVVTAVKSGDVQDLTFEIQKKDAWPPYLGVTQFLDSGRLNQSFPLPLVDRQQLSKLLLDVAGLDDRLYNAVEKAHDALGNFAHAREIFVGDLPTFPDLTEDERIRFQAGTLSIRTEGAVEALEALYLVCTGKTQLPLRVLH